MKMVVAIVQPQQFPAVKEALFEAQIKHLTATNILGTAPEGAEAHSFRGVVPRCRCSKRSASRSPCATSS